MQRLVVFIAIVFAFSSLAGASLAHAHRYESLPFQPLVVLNHVDADNVAVPVFVKVQRGEIDLGSGIVMPCGPHHGIPASVPVVPQGPGCDKPETAFAVESPLWPERTPRRPPKSLQA